MNTPQSITFGLMPITIEQVVSLSRHQSISHLQNAPAFRQRIARGAQFVDTLLDKEGHIYGITTGYGDSCVVSVPLHQVEALPQHLYTFHGCGMGRMLDAPSTRAVLAVRLQSLCQGMSGVRVELLERLHALIEHDILPLIPEEGSVGASGDLTPLSYVPVSRSKTPCQRSSQGAWLGTTHASPQRSIGIDERYGSDDRFSLPGLQPC